VPPQGHVASFLKVLELSDLTRRVNATAVALIRRASHEPDYSCYTQLNRCTNCYGQSVGDLGAGYEYFHYEQLNLPECGIVLKAREQHSI